MLKLIKNLLERNSVWFAILNTLVIVWLSLVDNIGPPKPEILGIDKLKHTSAYAVLTFWWFYTKKYKTLKISKLTLFLCILSFGITIEFLQELLTEHRKGDVYDVLANTIGSIIGITFFKLLNKLSLQE